MDPIVVIDRATKKRIQEKVYGQKALEFVYGNSLLSRLFGTPLLHLLIKWPFFAAWFGFCQNLPSSRKKILPFIKQFEVDAAEFDQPVSSYKTFNDFFTRKLKASSRPIAEGTRKAIIPADGRYLFYQNISLADGFAVKGKKFTLSRLLRDSGLASRYNQGSMVIARLCPSDYHRFHFPIDCIPSKPKLINGWLYSVNPLSVKKRIELFTQNRRMVTALDSESFGQVLCLEVGATCVGSIHQTFAPGNFYEKGEEKGYFSFGASSMILLFEAGRIQFDEDLVQSSTTHEEIRCLMGQTMGVQA